MNYGIRSIASRLCTPQIQAPLPTPLTLPYVCLRQLLAALSLTLTCLLALLIKPAPSLSCHECAAGFCDRGCCTNTDKRALPLPFLIHCLYVRVLVFSYR